MDHQEAQAIYDELISEFPEIERKGKNNPYTSYNGNMFSFLDKEGRVSIRFSQQELDAFLKLPGSELSIQHGAIMKGYAVVPENKMDDLTFLKKHLQKSWMFVQTLKAKPTKKK